MLMAQTGPKHSFFKKRLVWGCKYRLVEVYMMQDMLVVFFTCPRFDNTTISIVEVTNHSHREN